MQNTSDRSTEKQTDRQASTTRSSEEYTGVMEMKMTERGTLTGRQMTVHWVGLDRGNKRKNKRVNL